MLHLIGLFLVSGVIVTAEALAASNSRLAYEDMVNDINKIVSESKNLYKQGILDTNKKTAEYKEFSQQMVNSVETKDSLIPTTGISQINKWLTDYKAIKAIGDSTTKRNGLLIFVSFNMPSALLVKLDNTARKIGAKLKIRGLKNNSFKETISYIKGIQEKGIAVDIDPQAFEQFDIKSVPVFVLADGLKADKLVGNISMRYTLEQFAEHGDIAAKAKEYLKKLGNHEAS